MRHKIGIILSVLMLFIAVAGSISTSAWAAGAEETKEAKIIFTHDIHSHMEEFGKLKSFIDEKKSETQATFVLDGGDFSMGTLYQTIYETEASELTMLGYLEYDATTLGNHEFDVRPAGLANMLEHAKSNEAEDPSLKLPALLLANIDWSKNNTDDNILVKNAMDDYGSTPYIILDRGGIKVGIFGIMGSDSARCAPLSGLVFEDTIETSKKVVAELETKGVDMIICLSHSGIWDNIKKSEDEQLAMAVPEIDVIISGHTHSTLEEPVVKGNTYIVCAGEYLGNIGELDLVQEETGKWKIKDYMLNKTADMTKTDDDIEKRLEHYKEDVNETYLDQFGYTSDQVLTKNDIEFMDIDELSTDPLEDLQGELIADAYIYAVKQAEGENYRNVDVAIVPSGIIRGIIPKGDVTVWDVFNVSSLGVGADGIPGYPLVSAYLTGKELKLAAEVDASLSPYMTGTELLPSGMGWTYNKHRMLLNRVTDVWLENEDQTVSQLEDQKLYRIVVDLYTCQMLGSVKDKSFGLMSFEPKLIDGSDIADYESCIVRTADGGELKAWVALAKYLESSDHIDEKYSVNSGRKIIDESRSIAAILKNPNRFFAAAVGIVIALGGMIIGIFFEIRQIIRKRH